MRDLVSWSIPVGRLFGITIRVHWLFPLVGLGLVARMATQKDVLPDTWLDATGLVVLLFWSVLLHEFGHCFAARSAKSCSGRWAGWPTSRCRTRRERTSLPRRAARRSTCSSASAARHSFYR
jgi:hypothetical protein